MTQFKEGIHTGVLVEMLLWYFKDDGTSIKETVGKVYPAEPTMATLKEDVIAHTGCANTVIVSHAITNWNFNEQMNGCPTNGA